MQTLTCHLSPMTLVECREELTRVTSLLTAPGGWEEERSGSPALQRSSPRLIWRTTRFLHRNWLEKKTRKTGSRRQSLSYASRLVVTLPPPSSYLYQPYNWYFLFYTATIKQICLPVFIVQLIGPQSYLPSCVFNYPINILHHHLHSNRYPKYQKKINKLDIPHHILVHLLSVSFLPT